MVNADATNRPAASQRNALVTGGTSGIGKEIARGLADAGQRVFIVGRDDEKGRRAERELRETSGNADVTYVQGDLSRVHEAGRLADALCELAPALHYLVHGAGFVRGRRELTDEGIESNFAVNYVGRFALTARLLPSLLTAGRPGASSRVVILSGAATAGRISFDDPNMTNGFGILRVVGQFCRANDVFTIELARRLATAGADTRISVACLKIGVVKTGIRREFPAWMKVLVPLLLDPFLANSPAKVARHALDLLLSPAYEGQSGRHYLMIKRFKAIAPNAATRDPETGHRLWDLSEHLVANAMT